MSYSVENCNSRGHATAYHDLAMNYQRKWSQPEKYYSNTQGGDDLALMSNARGVEGEQLPGKNEEEVDDCALVWEVDSTDE